MKNAIVTGASSGIGYAITKRLLALGYSVTGVSRTIDEALFDRDDFKTIRCDLSDEKATRQLAEKLKKERCDLLINCAGFGKFSPHEELSAETIIKMTFLNLTAPMLLTNATLRSLKKKGGYLININSIEALRASKFAGVYSATKAGLKAFSDALFEETRKSDLSITNINPDMTESEFYNELNFDVTDNENQKLLAQDIADAVEHILDMRKGAVVTDYTIRSLHFGIKKRTATT
ncbi:MAG: SDR family NAD(P)-dependent oxidoreductase [Sulfurimonas sp.]